MSQSFKIRKGVDIRLKGAAEHNLQTPAKSDIYAVKPPDFHGLVPKMVVTPGEEVKAGSVLFHDKYNSKIKFVSPVSGEVAEIVRGEKRRILEVRILADNEINYETFDVSGAGNRDSVVEKLLDSGLWPFLKQRPFDVVANPESKPKSIHISGFRSAPLGPDADFIMQGTESDFQKGLDVLNTVADGAPVNLGVKKGSTFYNNFSGVNRYEFDGPHPAGNVGVQIHKISPINKGEVVWSIDPQAVVAVGRFFNSGKADFSKKVAVTGAEVSNPSYATIIGGCNVKSLLDGQLNNDNVRVISGNVLTGVKIATDGYLGFYDDQITAIPEGDEPQFFLTKGWLGPGLDKFSVSRSFPTWLMPKSKNWNLNTNENGEERAFVMTGQYEKVFPFNIYPVHLIKAIMINDIEAMENLGIYEVAPEDFALCEYACTSKIAVQDIVREGLDSVQKETA